MIGGGLAGLAATMKLAEAGIHVSLISMVPVKRSHSVCAQGGINSVNELTRQQGDNEWKHADDTVYGGDFLQNQPPVKEMCDWAPRVIDLLDRLGVPFNRTPEGLRDQRRFGGTLYKRTAFSGATTGQQMLYALDEQVRRWEADNPGAGPRNARTPSTKPATPAPAKLEYVNRPLYDALRSWRKSRADQDGVPAFVVFSDRTLVALAQARPADIDELFTVFGIGAAKRDRYGQEVLEVIADVGPGSENV